MTIRLKEEHPLCKQLDEIFTMMDKLGVTIIQSSDGSFIVRSKEFGEHHLIDIEHNFPSQWSGGIYEIPPSFEYKLVRERKG